MAIEVLAVRELAVAPTISSRQPTRVETRVGEFVAHARGPSPAPTTVPERHQGRTAPVTGLSTQVSWSVEPKFFGVADSLTEVGQVFGGGRAMNSGTVVSFGTEGTFDFVRGMVGG